MKPAVVVQGPYAASYTEKALLDYLECPGVDIVIFSTWIGFDGFKSGSLKHSAKLHVVLSSPPVHSGVQNVNYQLLSARSGIEKAVNLGCDIVIKLRSDFRYNIECILDNISRNGKRILGIESVSLVRNPYFICDFMFAGDANNMLSLFNSPMQICGDYRKQTSNVVSVMKGIEHVNSLYEYSSEDVLNAERYLLLNYLRNLGILIPKSFVHRMIIWPVILREYFFLIPAKLVVVDTMKNYAVLENERFKTSYHKFINSDNAGLYVLLSAVLRRMKSQFKLLLLR